MSRAHSGRWLLNPTLMTACLSGLLLCSIALAQLPLRVKGGAAADSLVLDEAGGNGEPRVGIGTDTPITNLDIVSEGDTRAQIRMTFTAGTVQDWRLQAGDQEFGITNETTENTPFVIEEDAKHQSLVVSDTVPALGGSFVGLGTANPIANLHIVGDFSPAIAFEVRDPVTYRWAIQATSSLLAVGDSTAGTARLVILAGAPTNAVTIDDDIGTGESGVGINRADADHPLHVGSTAANGNGAHVTAAGIWTDGSSRVNKTDIVDLAAEAAVNALQELTPVTYRGKQDSSREQYAGFIAEDVPELVATADRKGVAAIEIVAVVTKVVQEQQATIQEQVKTIEEQRADIEELRNRLDRLELLLTD